MNSDGKHPGSAPLRDQYQADDEISLIDLALVLLRRKWLIIGIFIICAGLGLAYALFMTGEPSYRYTTVVELGRMEDGKPVEDTDSVKTLLEQTLIPMFRSEMRSAHEDMGYRPPEVLVEIPSGSTRLIRLTSDSPQGREDEVIDLHEGLVDELKGEHNVLYFTQTASLEREKGDIRRALEADLADIDMRKFSFLTDIESIENNLKKLEEERNNINNQRERLQQEKAQIKDNINEAEKRLDFAREQQKRAPAEATDESRAMTLLMIQDQIEKADTRLFDLNHRFNVEIPDREDKLDLSLIDNNMSMQKDQRALEELKEKIENIKAEHGRTLEAHKQALAEINDKLNLMSPTEARYIGLQSMQSVGGTSKKLILALSLVLGGMLGVFGAFFAEFAGKIKEAANQRVSGSVNQ